MNIGIRTPAEVIAIALEDDGGIVPEEAKRIAERAATRLAACLKRLSNEEVVHILYAEDWKTLKWGHIKNGGAKP